MAQVTSDYFKKYGRLPNMARGSNSHLFGNGVSNHNKPLVSRRPVEVLTGVYSFDPRFLNYLRKLSEELNDKIKVSVDESGFTDNGVFTTFDRLRTVAGYMQNPMSFQMVHNGNYRKELGLQPGYNTVQREIAVNVWRIVLSNWYETPIKITKNSAGGLRRNTSDHEWKKDFCEFIFHEANLERLLVLIEANDWLALANEFEMVFLMYIQKRDQVDTPGKERFVFDLEYALTNGEKGRSRSTDRSIVIDGQSYDDFAATRARLVNAGPWVVNCVLSMMFSGHMQSMFHLFPDTWHINTEEEILGIVQGKHIYAGDVTEYDRSMPEDAIDTFHEVLAEFWDPRLAKMSANLYASAYYSRPTDINGKRGTLVGDYTDLGNKQIVAGNRSGHAATSLVAKVNKVIETLYLFHVMGLRVIGNERSFLRNQEAIGVVNNGDDELVHSSSKQLMDSFVAVRETLSHSVYLVTREKGCVYSGKCLMVDKFGSTQYKAVPRLATALEKIYTPERSIGGKFRPRWPIGVIERMNSRDQHPMGGQMWEIHDRLYHDMMAPHFGSLFGILADATLGMGIDIEQYTPAERELLDGQHKIHYKFKDDQISDKVLDIIMVKHPYQAYKHCVKRYYSGTVTERS